MFPLQTEYNLYHSGLLFIFSNNLKAITFCTTKLMKNVLLQEETKSAKILQTHVHHKDRVNCVTWIKKLPVSGTLSDDMAFYLCHWNT